MEPARGRPLRVLVIDDDPAACALVRDMLVRLGHVATTSADGLAGLEAYRAGDFDVVVTDVFMPEQGGFETIGELRRIDPRVRVIAISGGGRHEESGDVLTLAVRLGAKATLQKPFGLKDLERALFGVIEFG